MTVQEYIELDLPFFHITPIENKESILKYGLHRGKHFNAVCVVRSDEDVILHDIIISQLSNIDDDRDFIVIKLIPSIHQIKAIDVSPDDVSDPTNSLHNYLVDKTFLVSEMDIIKTIPIKNCVCVQINESKKEGLEGYLRGEKPLFEIL